MRSCYVHIPFCASICTYCDFCKMYYNSNWVDKYLESLRNEIEKNYKGEELSTIYIGGGTPTCLSEKQLEKLFKILEVLKKDRSCEYTIETNVESLNLNKIKLLKKYGVNRVSVGVQSVLDKNIKYLGRHHNKEQVKNIVGLLKKNGIYNINVDLIYALENQSIDDLKIDLDFLISLDIKHISTYSLIIEDNTKLGVSRTEPIEEEIDFEMYKYICDTLKQNGFIHYETSNFSVYGYESKHNLTYWNNEEYYGFGLGASGYIDGIRYDNTRGLNKYLNGNYKLNEEKINLNTKIENEFILGLRKIKGINKIYFKNKYNIDINKIDVVNRLLGENKLIDDGDNIYINPEKIYTSNLILIDFLGDSYGED